MLSRPVDEAQGTTPALDAAVAEFATLSDPQDRLKLLLEYGKRLEPLAASAKTDTNRVMGCTAQVGGSSLLQPASTSCLLPGCLCRSRRAVGLWHPCMAA